MIVKPEIGIFGLTGCSGEQIVILNCEDELLYIAGAWISGSCHRNVRE